MSTVYVLLVRQTEVFKIFVQAAMLGSSGPLYTSTHSCSRAPRSSSFHHSYTDPRSTYSAITAMKLIFLTVAMIMATALAAPTSANDASLQQRYGCIGGGSEYLVH